MNLKSIVYFSLFGLTCFNGNAQNSSDELLKINNIPFTVGEFERIYTKNFDLIKDQQQKEINNYLDLFILYKLKVAKAYHLGLDKDVNHANEFAMHRAQLADQYLTDPETLERLTKEAYERSKYEINASHIIFLADEFATPQDTLKAYNKALEVRELIMNGMDFSDAAVQFSDDPTAKNNKGNLGYFSILRMVYPFETGAYNTAVGEISMPIRSQFGYHLIKVNDKRSKKGKRNIAQIYLEVKDDKQDQAASVKINEIYNALQKGAKFEDLAVEYSEDLYSKNNGGVFSYYEPGMFNLPELDEAVYQLNNEGSYSKPFKSVVGWHIVKLVSDEPFADYEATKDNLLRKVQSDPRSRIIDKHLFDHLKSLYHYKENKANYDVIANEIIKNQMVPLKSDAKKDKIIASFADQKITSNEFIDQLNTNVYKIDFSTSVSSGIRSIYEDYVYTKIRKYYIDHLEEQFPEFKSTTQEFKEGLLLFDLMDKEVWQKVKSDSLGYTEFYNLNKNNYYQEEKIVGQIYSSASKSDLKKLWKLEQKNFGKESHDSIFNTDVIQVKKGSFTKNDKNLPKNYVLKSGVSDIIEANGMYYFIVANSFVPAHIPELEEVKQQVIYDYQQVFEKQWEKDLLNNADIELNKEILKQLKQKYQQN